MGKDLRELVYSNRTMSCSAGYLKVSSARPPKRKEEKTTDELARGFVRYIRGIPRRMPYHYSDAREAIRNYFQRFHRRLN